MFPAILSIPELNVFMPFNCSKLIEDYGCLSPLSIVLSAEDEGILAAEEAIPVVLTASSGLHFDISIYIFKLL